MLPQSICAVLVTYNRVDLLKECINSLLNQTITLDKICIVDNGSTDETPQYLQSINSDKITIITQSNVGSAGGFNTAIKYAYENNYDWIWTMDDDVEPFTDCLEQLLKLGDISKCINPLRLFKDNDEVYEWEHYFDYKTCMPIVHNNMSLRNKDYCFVNTTCFEGMLIHRSIVEKIGFPNQDYFIAGDDTEYGVLANLYTNVAYTKTAKMYRKRLVSLNKIRPLQAYYEFRNLFLLKRNLRMHFLQRNSPSFYRNLYRELKYRTKLILKGKEYTMAEKKDLISRMIRGIRDGIKLYKVKTNE